jgi:lactate dehydrogenase-like 2-hydroxyacid dehydrogenase
MERRWRVFVTRELPGLGFAGLIEDPRFSVDVWAGDFPPEREALIEHVVGVDGLICLITDAIDEPVLKAAGDQLRVVSQMAVGVDNIDLDACAARGIPVGNTPGVLTETTADIAWALILASARRVVEAAEYVKHGDWRTWAPTQLAGVDVYGSTLGVIGFGAIGQAVARRAQGFGMRTLYWNRTHRPAEAAAVGAEYRSFEDLLAQSDVVSINIALTDETRGLIDAGALARMQPGSILVNTARGPIVDEDALAEALAAKRIRGAGLDVTAVEPLSMDSPLLTMDNVVVLPHIGSASLATRSKMADMAVANLRAGLAGEPLPHQAGV